MILINLGFSISFSISSFSLDNSNNHALMAFIAQLTLANSTLCIFALHVVITLARANNYIGKFEELITCNIRHYSTK